MSLGYGFAKNWYLMISIERRLLCVQTLRDRRLAAEIPYTSTVDVEASKHRARNIDRVSRRTFPLAFVIFNIIYWVAYSIPSSDKSDVADEL